VVDAPDTDNSEKIEMLLILLGGISVGLAFTNMLPIPGLDGNAIVLTVVEMIRGKKLSRKSEQVINVIGFVMIIALVIFALVSDIIRLSR
jgi:membrane-associated protease RseP (regulator of RpoE activity)